MTLGNEFPEIPMALDLSDYQDDLLDEYLAWCEEYDATHCSICGDKLVDFGVCLSCDLPKEN